MNNNREKLKSWHEYLETIVFPQWLFEPDNMEIRRRAVIGFYSGILAIGLLLVFAVVAILQNRYLNAFVDIGIVAAFVCIMVYFRRTKIPDSSVFDAALAVIGFFSVYLCFSGEADNSAFLWIYTFPLAAMFLLGLRKGTIATALFLLTVSVILLFDNYIPYVVHFSLNLKLRLAPSLFAVAALSFLFEQSRQMASQKMNLALRELEKSKEVIEQQVRERTSQLFAANEKLLQEVAERKEAVEALKKSEERLRFALEGANDGFWDFNMKTGEFYISTRGHEILGYSPDEMKKLAKDWKNLVHPDDLALTRGRFKAHLEGRVPVYEVEQRLRIKSGDWKWVLNRGKVTEKDDKGLPVRMTGTHTDISKRIKAEEEKNKLEERLQRSEKMETMGQLAGGVAHDLNNILGVLVGYSELMLLEIPEGHSLRRHVSNIMNSGERAAAIIQDLLALARRGVAAAEVVNLNSIVEDYLNTPEFESLKSRYSRVNYRINLEKQLLNIKGSSVHLGKTIMNLIANATEAITDQGEVIIETTNRHLDKPVCAYEEMAEGDYVVITVRDNGKGIALNDIGKIFEPFYTKKIMGRSGTGLGLAVVWGTVKDHHGYIDVQSEENKGSAFSLYFPVTRAPKALGREHITPEVYQGRGESLLIVDDVKEQRELAATILNGLGYQADIVNSGEEALEYLKKNKADLLVLDMIMDPGIDGLTTYERALKINPAQRAIIVSGFSETERVKKAQELGAGEYVLKPYIREHLGLAVRRELDRK